MQYFKREVFRQKNKQKWILILGITKNSNNDIKWYSFNSDPKKMTCYLDRICADIEL